MHNCANRLNYSQNSQKLLILADVPIVAQLVSLSILSPIQVKTKAVLTGQMRILASKQARQYTCRPCRYTKSAFPRIAQRHYEKISV